MKRSKIESEYNYQSFFVDDMDDSKYGDQCIVSRSFQSFTNTQQNLSEGETLFVYN